MIKLSDALAVQTVCHKVKVQNVIVDSSHKGARWDRESDIFYVRSMEELRELYYYVNKYTKIHFTR